MSSITRAVAGMVIGAMVCVTEAGVVARSPRQSGVHPLLDVPYVAQTPELCGGAAVAMVLRYWGEHEVFAQDFAPLIKPGDGGIPTDVLASAVRDRGWQALVVPASDDAHARIRSEIDQGRPLIALIEVAPQAYHYVVIVGSTDQEVVLHDPARAPFRVLPWPEFDRAWMATGRWMLLVLPPNGFRAATPGAQVSPASPGAAAPAPPAPETPCAALVARGVDLALAGDHDGAESELVAATRLCPDDPASWQELAGLRFSQSRWPEARDLALSAVRLAPDDTYAWQIVATSRYLLGDVMGALDAWNHTGEPRVDTIDIHGAKRTRQPVIVRAAGLQPRQLLTPEALTLAQRRLSDLPVALAARTKYEPIDGGSTSAGLANVDVFIDERPLVPSGWLAFATLGVRAAVRDEAQVDVAGLLGAGEMASALWRWSAPRPRVAFDLAVPSPQWLSGVISFEGSWERQTYDTASSSSGPTLARETRRRVGLQAAEWSTSWLKWQAGAALDNMREYDGLQPNRFGARDYLAAESALDVRLLGDHLALGASVGWWAPFAGGDQFETGALQAAWRSSDGDTRASWSAVTEIGTASRMTPLALWQGAGTGQGRGWLLRAHPLLDDDVLNGAVFGRDAAHGTVEYVRPVGHTLAGGLSIAAFLDSARAWQRLSGLAASPLYVDAGVGVRLRAPGSAEVIRIDVAHGLRGGGTTLSAGWSPGWPR